MSTFSPPELGCFVHGSVMLQDQRPDGPVRGSRLLPFNVRSLERLLRLLQMPFEEVGVSESGAESQLLGEAFYERFNHPDGRLPLSGEKQGEVGVVVLQNRTGCTRSAAAG